MKLRDEIPYGYVYKITNKVNRKTYLGQRQLNKDTYWREYLGSGSLILKALYKYGKKNFVKEFICYAYSQNELFAKERYYILRERFILGKSEYNLTYPLQTGAVKYLSGKDYEKTGVKSSRKAVSERIIAENREKYRRIFEKHGDDIIDRYEEVQHIAKVSKEFSLPRMRVRDYLVEEGVELNDQTKKGVVKTAEERRSISEGVKSYHRSLCIKSGCKERQTIGLYCSFSHFRESVASEIVQQAERSENANLFVAELKSKTNMCKACGESFYSNKPSPKYCSVRCYRSTSPFSSITEKTLNKSVNRFKKGEPIKKIAKDFNLNRKTLSEEIKKLGYTVTPRNHKPIIYLD